MDIDAVTGIECKIPLQNVLNFDVSWTINRHAELELIGEVNPDEAKELNKDYMGTGLELFFLGESRERGQTIFKGIVSYVQFEYECGSCRAVIKGISSSKLLDDKIDSHSFQDVSKTYAEVVKEVVTAEGGSVICTAGRSKIEKPVIRYKETAWEYVRRIASLSHTYVIPDIATGRPNLWFGMRKGARIVGDIGGWDSADIMKQYVGKGAAATFTSYQIESRKLYRIGDYKEIEGQDCVIYQVKMSHRRGELVFRYFLIREAELATRPYSDETFIGLSLSGKVCRTENESVFIRLDIDGKDGEYPFPWRPETGNVFYAMPESETPVALSVSSIDDGEAFGVRCLHREGSPKNKNGDAALKTMETTDGNKISLFPEMMGFSKQGEHSVDLTDGEGIGITSSDEIRIEAQGKIRMKAERIVVTVPEEIKSVVK